MCNGISACAKVDHCSYDHYIAGEKVTRVCVTLGSIYTSKVDWETKSGGLLPPTALLWFQ